ncbi:S-layer homology domain-containing protein [Salibacterium qingdaonense]|uniref:S-layer homology domain-containing protein n=1 Tax=Salibacterium qingdaonense TaxID=266892 RepID=A0A1I4NY31_9BACI|nr:S-layer homology domain-containing protein [Salibacterium qingdaonense]SFM20296.1 S-layer homology domain-containing protein [Salibacterium qingdaonense]
MAYQPKSYRRFLASSVSAAVVASAAAAVPADVQQADAAESFTDVSNDYWASESIQRLADEGIINGYPDGTYGPGEDINRGQVAELLVNAFDLEVNQNAESSFDDLNDDSYYTPFAEAVEEAGYITGREDGTMFAAGMDLSREQMATILVRAFNLEAQEDSDANVADLDEANASHQENIQILADYDITSTENDMFRPKETVNRAQFATFLDRALEVQEPQSISNVSTLTGDGHVLSVEFTRPYRENLSASDIMIAESDSGERKGVESVSLAADGMSAQITLFDDTSDNAPDEIQEGVQHDIQVGDLSTTFTRDQFLNDDDNARVTSVNDDDREFTVTYNEDNGDGDETTVTLDVPEDSDFNFQQALGHEISVWYDGDNNLTNYELIQHEDTLNTAIEVTENNEIETVEGGNAHDLAEDVTFTVNDGSDDEIVAEGTDEVEEEGLVDQEYDYAKVIFNDNGDVQRVYAYDFSNNEPILTESVDGSVVIGRDSDELDLEDYRIVKNGQQIAPEDIQEGDVVFYNEDAYDGDGFAVVGTNTESGAIENVYDDSFDFEGTTYDYNDDSNDLGTVQYLDEDGEFADLGEDEAEALMDAGDVTLYKNFKGDLVYVTGATDGIEQTYNAFYLQGMASPYVSSTGDVSVELEGVNSEGNSYLYDFAPDSLDEITVQTSDGEKVYETNQTIPDGDEEDSADEIDEFALAEGSSDNLSLISADETAGPISGDTFLVALNDSGDIINDEVVVNLSEYGSDLGEDYSNNVINVGEDSDGNVQELEFFDNVSSLNNSIDEDSDYANGSLLEDSTLVYDVSDADMLDPDEEDVNITTWGDLKEGGVDINAGEAAVYSDEDDRVTHLVTYEDVISSGEEHTAVIKDVQTSDDDIVRVDVLVNGEERTYEVNDLDPGFDVSEGSVVEIEVNDADDLITGFNDLNNAGENNDEDRLVSGTVIEDGVSVGDDEVTVNIDGEEETFELANDGAVYDASDNDADDYSVENLRDIEDGDNVTIAKPSEDSGFADAVVKTGEGNQEDDQQSSINGETYEGYSSADNEVILDGETYPVTDSVGSFFGNNDSALNGNDISVDTSTDGTVTSVTGLEINNDNTDISTTSDFTINGDVVVNGQDVSLDGLTITGDLIVTQDSDFDASNVEVQGETNIENGDGSTAKFTNSTLATVNVNYDEHVSLQGTTTADTVNLASDGADLELAAEAEVSTTNVTAANTTISGSGSISTLNEEDGNETSLDGNVTVDDESSEDTLAPEPVTNLSFEDTNYTDGEVSGDITFTASTSDEVDTTTVSVNGSTENVSESSTSGDEVTYTVSGQSVEEGSQIEVVVADAADNEASQTLDIEDQTPIDELNAFSIEDTESAQTDAENLLSSHSDDIGVDVSTVDSDHSASFSGPVAEDVFETRPEGGFSDFDEVQSHINASANVRTAFKDAVANSEDVKTVSEVSSIIENVRTTVENNSEYLNGFLTTSDMTTDEFITYLEDLASDVENAQDTSAVISAATEYSGSNFGPLLTEIEAAVSTDDSTAE